MKKKKPENRFLAYFLISILILLVGIALYDKVSKNKYLLPILSLENFSQVAVKVEGQSILLFTNCYKLTMTTTAEQTESIASALENAISARPNSHDLFAYNLRYFNISLLFVKVHSLIDGTYYAKIFLKQGNNLLILDSRPSDAIAIALRVDARVYLNKELLKYAEKIC